MSMPRENMAVVARNSGYIIDNHHRAIVSVYDNVIMQTIDFQKWQDE